MQDNAIFEIPQYSLEREKKEQLLVEELSLLTSHHLKNSSNYRKIHEILYPGQHRYGKLSDIPYLPVGLFKTHDLLSIPRDQIYKTLTSSGTTSSLPSKVFLDSQTAQLQAAALANIMISFLGKKRLPMLIVDAPTVIKDRKSFSARGAGILGMMNFGRDHLYILNEHMELDHEALSKWAKKHQNTPILLFGFTFMVWKYFVQQIVDNEITLPEGILIHSGGWKKLQEEAVSNTLFKETLQKRTDIKRCHSFYGMVEQVGSVFVECEEGYLHTPNFAEVIVRDPTTWLEAPHEKEGVIQVLSTLPKSYPGHSLLTEDLGKVIGIDNCRCGRKGKYFEIQGRVPKAELRGCSDTHAYSTN